ncbi:MULTISPECIES: DUF308 domain-containing protein [Streptococcus]|uniref:DUF308 domain-containing protein n=1 Tax=Streptococcus caledonicus TaxID=2614158 RepID=A0ABW0UCL0_9STRE|nr:DUF308 domain-containing protein [Streptococcus sp. S784/96/1]
MKTLSLIISISSLILGIYLFNHPFAAVGTIASVIAFVIFVTGLNQLRLYFYLPETHRSLRLLVKASLSTLVGFLLMTSSAFFRSNLILSMLSLWLLILGISRLMMGTSSLQNRNDKRQTWGILGIGLLLFIAPVFSSVFIGKFFSLIFIIIGASTMLLGKRF